MTESQKNDYRVIAEDAQYNTNTLMYGEIIETCLDEIERLEAMAYPRLPTNDEPAKAGEIQVCTGQGRTKWMSLDEYKKRYLGKLNKDELIEKYVDAYIEGKGDAEF